MQSLANDDSKCGKAVVHGLAQGSLSLVNRLTGSETVDVDRIFFLLRVEFIQSYK